MAHLKDILIRLLIVLFVVSVMAALVDAVQVKTAQSQTATGYNIVQEQKQSVTRGDISVSQKQQQTVAHGSMSQEQTQNSNGNFVNQSQNQSRTGAIREGYVWICDKGHLEYNVVNKGPGYSANQKMWKCDEGHWVKENKK